MSTYKVGKGRRWSVHAKFTKGDNQKTGPARVIDL